jgi:hypothetical protein
MRRNTLRKARASAITVRSSHGLMQSSQRSSAEDEGTRNWHCTRLLSASKFAEQVCRFACVLGMNVLQAARNGILDILT